MSITEKSEASLSGLRLRNFSDTGSVASASAAKLSMIMLIQSSCTAENTEVASGADTAGTAVMLKEIWVCKRLRRTARWHNDPTWLLWRRTTISDASLATSEYLAMSMENPTLAVLGAGPSFLYHRQLHQQFLQSFHENFSSSGEERARTCSRGTSTLSCWFSPRKTSPSMMLPSMKMPHWTVIPSGEQFPHSVCLIIDSSRQFQNNIGLFLFDNNTILFGSAVGVESYLVDGHDLPTAASGPVRLMDDR